MRLPFALRRPWLLWRGARTDRDRPDLAELAGIEDPETFVWAVLPHAARTFATSILLLPRTKARTAAVAYLYCRMLDTYEDLGDPGCREEAMRHFAGRMRTMEPRPEPPPPESARDDRDRVHLLLLERCHLVDEVYATLPGEDRSEIAGLVERMADGMIWSAQRFTDQGGVLTDEAQVSRYCHAVIGEPISFTLPLVLGRGLTEDQRADALASSELIQLANITRDIERDLARGVAYRASLRPYLGHRDAAEPVRAARRSLTAQALPQVSAYVRLGRRFGPTGFSISRAAAVVMLLNTERHYRRCMELIGERPWPETKSRVGLAVAAMVSSRHTLRAMRRVERSLLAGAATLAGGAEGAANAGGGPPAVR
jgi:phytoene/squalene synthetase